MNDKIEIPLSKKKLILLLVGAIVFVIFGLLMTINPENFISAICRSPEIIRISGIAGVVFCGTGIIFLTRKLFDNKPGLIIDQYGITNNANAMDMGLIEWEDITGIEKIQIRHNKFLILHTNQPKKYIDRTKNMLAKQTMKMNNKVYGSPISITSNSLKIDFDDLERLIRAEQEKGKTTVSLYIIVYTENATLLSVVCTTIKKCSA